MENERILIAALKDDKFMKTVISNLHGFQVRTIEPAFEGELIRALNNGNYSPAVLIISYSICDTSMIGMIERIRKVSDAQIILAAPPGCNISEEIKELLFSILELPQEPRRVEMIIKSAVQGYFSAHGKAEIMHVTKNEMDSV